MRSFSSFISMALVLGMASFCQAQSTGGGAPVGGATAPGASAAGGGAGKVEYDIDLPLSAPTIAAPKSSQPPPPPPPPPPPTQPPGNPPTFYGHPLQSENSTVFFVIDISGSMGWDMGQYTAPDGSTQTGDRLDRAKAELTKCVTALPSNFKFNMMSYDCGQYPWQGGLVPANQSNIQAANGWIAQLQPQGATGTGPAVAAALGADRTNMLLVLLTDGGPNCGAGDGYNDPATYDAHRQMIDQANTQKAVINVFGICATGDMKAFCQGVASDNNGQYVDVQ
ncbi:MAG TPA: hypothetical protein VFF73_18980 [Planctomycetota bacterium]|nr:hypothetical protein [Planctomycetota bacterium]